MLSFFSKAGPKATSDLPATTAEFNGCMDRFYAKLGKSRADDLTEQQIFLFVTAGAKNTVLDLSPDDAETAEDAVARKQAMLVTAFQGVSALFQIACPRSNRTAKQIDKAKNLVMQHVALRLLGDEIEHPTAENEQLVADASQLYAKLATRQNKIIRELNMAWVKFIHSPFAKADVARIAKSYEQIYGFQQQITGKAA